MVSLFRLIVALWQATNEKGMVKPPPSMTRKNRNADLKWSRICPKNLTPNGAGPGKMRNQEVFQSSCVSNSKHPLWRSQSEARPHLRTWTCHHTSQPSIITRCSNSSTGLTIRTTRWTWQGPRLWKDPLAELCERYLLGSSRCENNCCYRKMLTWNSSWRRSTATDSLGLGSGFVKLHKFI